MLKFIYTGSVEMEKECEMELFQLADKYILTDLKDFMAVKLAIGLTVENFTDIVLLAHFPPCPLLQRVRGFF